MVDNEKMNYRLCDFLASLDTPEKVRMLLEDMCTYKEIEYMAQRVEGARLLMQKNTYNQIIAETNISTATLGRINKCIQHGSGGYNILLKEYMEKQEQK